MTAPLELHYDSTASKRLPRSGVVASLLGVLLGNSLFLMYAAMVAVGPQWYYELGGKPMWYAIVVPMTIALLVAGGYAAAMVALALGVQRGNTPAVIVALCFAVLVTGVMLFILSVMTWALFRFGPPDLDGVFLTLVLSLLLHIIIGVFLVVWTARTLYQRFRPSFYQSPPTATGMALCRYVNDCVLAAAAVVMLLAIFGVVVPAIGQFYGDMKLPWLTERVMFLKEPYWGRSAVIAIFLPWVLSMCVPLPALVIRAGRPAGTTFSWRQLMRTCGIILAVIVLFAGIAALGLALPLF